MSVESSSSRRKRQCRTLAIFLVCLQIIASFHSINGFQLSMVASSTPFGRTLDNKSLSSGASYSRRSNPSPASSITSNLVSQLAVGALKRRLKDQTHVACDLTASSTDMLRGRVGPVTVKGRGWQSRLGLTCRAIEATVETCELDMGRVLSSQKLVLTVPAQGRSMVALNAVDFGNFITHPLMKPPSTTQGENNQLQFLKNDVVIDATTGKVTFYGTYTDKRWKFSLQRGKARQAVISVSPDTTVGEDLNEDNTLVARELQTVASNFFNKMVFELDGTFLSFMDMMVTQKLNEPIAMLSLDITVKKFPSAGIDF